MTLSTLDCGLANPSLTLRLPMLLGSIFYGPCIPQLFPSPATYLIGVFGDQNRSHGSGSILNSQANPTTERPHVGVFENPKLQLPWPGKPSSIARSLSSAIFIGSVKGQDPHPAGLLMWTEDAGRNMHNKIMPLLSTTKINISEPVWDICGRPP